MIGEPTLLESKEAAARWAVLFHRALPDCEDVEEAIAVANLAFEELSESVMLATEFEEKKHPRDESGQFTDKIGEIPHGDYMSYLNKIDSYRDVPVPQNSPRTEKEIEDVHKYTKETKQFIALLVDDPLGLEDQDLDAAQLDKNKRQQTKEKLQKCVEWMTPKMQSEIRQNLGGIYLYESTTKLTALVGRAAEGVECGGFVQINVGDRIYSLHIDGGYSDNPDSASGIYAHELGHLLDPFGRQSDTNEWHDAWSEEIKRADFPLSKYATIHPREGWAEFSRLLLTGRYKEAKTDFPKCYSVWKSRGLI